MTARHASQEPVATARKDAMTAPAVSVVTALPAKAVNARAPAVTDHAAKAAQVVAAPHVAVAADVNRVASRVRKKHPV